MSGYTVRTRPCYKWCSVAARRYNSVVSTPDLYRFTEAMPTALTLSPLAEDDRAAYIQHYLNAAATQTTPIFTKAALKQIVDQTHGIPKIINITCSDVLVAGLLAGEKTHFNGHGAIGVRRRGKTPFSPGAMGPGKRRRPTPRRGALDPVAIYAPDISVYDADDNCRCALCP